MKGMERAEGNRNEARRNGWTKGRGGEEGKVRGGKTKGEGRYAHTQT